MIGFLRVLGVWFLFASVWLISSPSSPTPSPGLWSPGWPKLTAHLLLRSQASQKAFPMLQLDWPSFLFRLPPSSRHTGKQCQTGWFSVFPPSACLTLPTVLSHLGLQARTAGRDSVSMGRLSCSPLRQLRNLVNSLRSGPSSYCVCFSFVSSKHTQVALCSVLKKDISTSTAAHKAFEIYFWHQRASFLIDFQELGDYKIL